MAYLLRNYYCSWENWVNREFQDTHNFLTRELYEVSEQTLPVPKWFEEDWHNALRKGEVNTWFDIMLPISHDARSIYLSQSVGTDEDSAYCHNKELVLDIEEYPLWDFDAGSFFAKIVDWLESKWYIASLNNADRISIKEAPVYARDGFVISNGINDLVEQPNYRRSYAIDTLVCDNSKRPRLVISPNISFRRDRYEKTLYIRLRIGFEKTDDVFVVTNSSTP